MIHMCPQCKTSHESDSTEYYELCDSCRDSLFCVPEAGELSSDKCMVRNHGTMHIEGREVKFLEVTQPQNTPFQEFLDEASKIFRDIHGVSPDGRDKCSYGEVTVFWNNPYSERAMN